MMKLKKKFINLILNDLLKKYYTKHRIFKIYKKI